MSFPVLSDPRQPEVHASTLLLVEHTLLCAWFGGTKEGHGDTKIWLSRKDVSLDDQPWSEPIVVASEDGLAHWNPVLLRLPDASILLFYKVGSPISSWYTKCISSLDGGQRWSESRELVEGDRGGRGPVKNKAIILDDGTILAPASIETPDGIWDAFSDRSSDGGKTWHRSELVKIDRSAWPGEGAIQPSLIKYGPSKISMLLRSSAGFVARADSSDNGQTWGQLYTTPLFNNNSGIDALRLEDGSWLVAHNPVQQRWGPRTPLVLSRSSDEGRTWDVAVTLEDKQPPAGFERILALDTGIVNDGQSEFSYPAVISDGECGVHVSYTYERKGIKHVHLDGSYFT